MPADHPPRPILAMTNGGDDLPRLNGMYVVTDRPSIAPELLLRPLLIQMLYTVRSARLLVEQSRVKLQVGIAQAWNLAHTHEIPARWSTVEWAFADLTPPINRDRHSRPRRGSRN